MKILESWVRSGLFLVLVDTVTVTRVYKNKIKELQQTNPDVITLRCEDSELKTVWRKSYNV